MDQFLKHFVLVILSISCVIFFANGENDPEFPDIDVKFYLYTRQVQDVPQEILYRNVSRLNQTFFWVDKPIKILIHGYGGNKDSPMNALIKDVYLPLFAVNVIVVDWKSGDVNNADKLTTDSGKFLGKFIDWLSELGAPFSNFHLIGHSLGAQLAGIAGRSCKRGKVAYISALDPPRRGWEGLPQNISPRDGEYVEVMHTYIAGNSLIQPAGHADFYPNGGQRMPGCVSEENYCSHLKAYEYFADSIDHTWFVADKCTNYEELAAGNCAKLGRSYMGSASPKNATGVYWLATAEEKPFYKGY